MKILWFSNCQVVNKNINGTGSWLNVMAQSLTSQNIALYNITCSASVSDIIKVENEKITEWVVPTHKYNIQKIPTKATISKLNSIIAEVQPDVIHVWGLEMFWSRLFTEGYLNYPFLLEIQGLYSACGRVFFGGMSVCETLKTFGLKEILKPRLCAFIHKAKYDLWGKKYEEDILRKVNHLSVQSLWVRAQVEPMLSYQSHVYQSIIGVRDEFYEAHSWRLGKENAGVILAVFGGSNPFKGIHCIIKAISILKNKGYAVKFRLIGGDEFFKPEIKKSGYVKYLERLINKYNIKDITTILGNMTASEMINEMQAANVVVNASYVESYSLGLAETMVLGVPSVVAFAGAMPELTADNISSLMFSPGDEQMCAYQIEKIINSPELASNLSINSIELSKLRNRSEYAAIRQIQNYKAFISNIQNED